MAAQDRFSLHRYSLGSADNHIFLEQTFTDALGGVAGAAVPINAAAYFSDSLQMTARGTTALLFRFEAGDSLQGSAAACADIRLGTVFADALGQSAYAAKDIGLEMLAVDALMGEAYAGKQFRANGSRKIRFWGSLTAPGKSRWKRSSSTR